MAKQFNKNTRVRSSITGRFVPKSRAKSSPRTTQTEVMSKRTRKTSKK